MQERTIKQKSNRTHLPYLRKSMEKKKLLDCLERNEKNGIVYHRNGINGDYDDFDDVEQLMNFILTGVR